MADIKATLNGDTSKFRQVYTYTYPAFTQADTFFPVPVGDLSEITVQAYGAMTGGGTVKLQGSNDPRVVTDPGNAVWYDLTTNGTTALSFTGAGAKNMHEHPMWVKPAFTGSLAATQLAITGKRITL